MCNIMYGNFFVNGMIATSTCLLSSGPLNTSVEVKAYEGDTAELLCFLPAPSKLRIKGGSWTRDPASDVHFPTLIWTQNHLKWNSTSVKPNRVTFSDQELNPHFNVALKKVKTKNVYCVYGWFFIVFHF